MKKQWLTFLTVILFTVISSAQAILPASWGFDTPAPEGWTESLGTSNTRYTNGFVLQACKLDATADYVVLHFAEEPGAISYYIKGQNTGGSWQGTFTIQESEDGSSFTPLQTFVDADLPTGAFTLFTHNPLATSRYIRFYYTNKVSGSNVGLDEINLATPVSTTAQEINVTDGTNNIPSGITYSTGNSVSQDFTIQNTGLSTDLNISSVTLSGGNASEFSLGTTPTVIAALSSADFTLNFNPIGTGSRFCTITINSDDVSEAVYVINIYAISGDYASEPTAQAGSLSFSNIKAWDYQSTLAPGSPVADNYLVLRKKNGTVTEMPVDGVSYPRGSWIGSSQVVYNGEAGNFDARNVEAGAVYELKAFAYNGPVGYENYLVTTPLVNNVTAPAPSIGSFYNGVNHNSPTFVSTLTSVMNPANYFQVYYSNYISTLIDNFYAHDTVVGGVTQNYVECGYSGNDYIYPAGFQWWSGSGSGLSREHSFPQSWMPTYFDAGFDQSFEVSDLHNLFPTLQEECNAVRSNYPYGEVVAPTSTFQDCMLGDNSIGQEVYEMRDSFKGNAARGVMYHSVKNNSATNDFSFPEQISLTIQYGQSDYVIKQWHFDDLPDSYEITRNEYIQYEQHNRNAFIDSVQLPCFIRFSNLTKFTPIITYTGTTVTCTDPGMSYQWYLEGEMIDGANTPSYSWTQEGNYSVTLQQFEECPTFTSSQVFVTNAVNEISDVTFNVYPNPSAGQLNFQVDNRVGGKAVLSIKDASGKLVHSESLMITPGASNHNVDTHLSAGIYIIELNTNAGILTNRLIVE